MLEDRIRETEEQIKFHRRKALYCEGLQIEGPIYVPRAAPLSRAQGGVLWQAARRIAA